MDDMKIGGMHGDLSIDVRGWATGLEDAREGLADFAKEVAASFKELETKIRNVGLGLTAAITVPFAGMAIISKRGAGAFEKSMNNVNAALRGISTDQLTALSVAARKLGPDVGRSAKEAADGIETLALAGMSASEILDGGLAQTLRLAAANAAGLGESAAVVTDVMVQFGKGTGDLAGVVNNITGALDASKLGFNDFKDAIAQGGGVAGSAGVSFEDFNTALAGTAALFGSGSDAGTSFKTLITTLTPKSKEAGAVMEKLGLDFFDATGRMKGLADIAEMLREKLGNLSDRSRTDALTTMFGTDGMRTAIGLMRLGGRAFEDLQKTIGQTDAGEKLAIQMQGAEAATSRLSNAFERLKIVLGATGILAVFTSVTNAMTGFVNGIANLPPALLSVGVAVWGFAAAIGPLTLAVLTLAKFALPLAFGQLGLFGKGLAILINPIGVLISWLGRLALGMVGVSAAFGTAGAVLLRLAGPIGIAATALTLLYMWSNRAATANNAAKQAAMNAAAGYEKQQAASLGLVSATGEARISIINKMKADRAAELQAMATARADVIAAKAALERAKGNLSKAKSEVVMSARGDVISPKVAPAIKAVQQEEANLLSYAKALDTVAKTVEGYNRSIATPEFGTVDLDLGGSSASNGGKPTGTAAQELADRQEQMKIEQQLAVARARGDVDEERRIQDRLDLLRLERDYEDAGLARAAARVAAARDMVELKAAEAEFNKREIEKAEDSMNLQIAEMRNDFTFIKTLRDKEYLNERIAFWQSKRLSLAEAEKRAATDLRDIEAARLEMSQRAAAADSRDRELELARLRGDSEAKQRAIEMRNEIERRAERIAERDGVNIDVARDQATIEVNEEDQARVQGQWRDTFKGAIRAAMDGDLGGFAKNWWKDHVAKGMEDALNSLSDMLFNLFRTAMGQGGAAGASGGGGIGGLFGSILGSVFGTPGGGIGGGLPGAGPVISGGGGAAGFVSNLPRFATGGSFEVGGKPGIDTNLVQFWGSAGETVNVRRPGNDNGGGSRVHIVPSPYFDAIVDQRATGVAAPMVVSGSSYAQNGAVAEVARRQSRRIP